MLKSYPDISSPANLAAHVESEMSEIGQALATVRQSIKLLHRDDISSQALNQKATDISNKLYQTVRDITGCRTALVRDNQSYRTHVNKILCIIRAMRKVSKIGENAQIDAIVAMQLRLVSDAKSDLLRHRGERVSAIDALFKVQSDNWSAFAKVTRKINVCSKEQEKTQPNSPLYLSW